MYSGTSPKNLKLHFQLVILLLKVCRLESINCKEDERTLHIKLTALLYFCWVILSALSLDDTGPRMGFQTTELSRNWETSTKIQKNTQKSYPHTILFVWLTNTILSQLLISGILVTATHFICQDSFLPYPLFISTHIIVSRISSLIFFQIIISVLYITGGQRTALFLHPCSFIIIRAINFWCKDKEFSEQEKSLTFNY